ncbi:MAG: rod shape-determining protein MreC [Solirubrobacterales bacterium]|nr:rod shape-determining protein MreC [Solirubrobacterales bacterium]
MHNKHVRRRRVTLAALVCASLILLTAYFGGSPSSPLHTIQRGVVQVLSPIQQGASTVLSPVRDVAGWFSDTLHARSQVTQLRKKVQRLTAELAQAQEAEILNRQLSREVHLDATLNIDAYQPVTADVINQDPTLWYQQIEIDKGSGNGIRLDQPVIGDGALVGRVSLVGSSFAIVQLITDHSVDVAAQVQDQNGDVGILVPAVGDPNELLLQDLPHIVPGQPGPQVGQLVVTAGYKSGPLQSLYPRGIPIGQVSNANQNNLINNNEVTVSPAANLRHLAVVQVLTAPHGQAVRAQVP